MWATLFSVRRLPLRAKVTFYSVRDYAILPHLAPPFQKCRISVPNVPMCTFRALCCVVPYLIVLRYVSLIFPFLRRRTMGKRSNKERINDDAWWLHQRQLVHLFSVFLQCCCSKNTICSKILNNNYTRVLWQLYQWSFYCGVGRLYCQLRHWVLNLRTFAQKHRCPDWRHTDSLQSIGYIFHRERYRNGYHAGRYLAV